MSKNLKEKQYYEDLYDSETIEDCKRMFCNSTDRKFLDKEINKYKDKKSASEMLNKWADTVDKIGLYFFKGDRYRKREETIREWMAKDRNRDQKLENTNLENIKCKYCNTLMDLIDKDYFPKNIEPLEESILFIYSCPKCKKSRAIFENNEEYIPKKVLCPKCNNELDVKGNATEDKLITTYKCNNCDYINIDEIERFKPENKEIDYEQFLKNKKEYCLDDKEGMEYVSQSIRLESLTKEFEKDKEKEKQKATYDKIKELNKPKIFDLQELLSKGLEKYKFVKLNFKEPQIEKFITIEFTIYDSESSRSEYDAKNILQKQIEAILKETNWILMSDGISYRLGMLSGRLKAYEREEDLVELVNKRFKDLKPKEEKIDSNRKDWVVKGANGEDITL